MSVVLSGETLKLAKDLESLTGENVMLCYQCKKCTLGCPAAYTMKMRPHELMRATQLGLDGGDLLVRHHLDLPLLRNLQYALSPGHQHPPGDRWVAGACYFEEGRLLQSPARDPRAAPDLYGLGGAVWKGLRIGSGPAHQSEDAHPVQRHRHGLSHVLEGKAQAPPPLQPWGKRTSAGDGTNSKIGEKRIVTFPLPLSLSSPPFSKGRLGGILERMFLTQL